MNDLTVKERLARLAKVLESKKNDSKKIKKTPLLDVKHKKKSELMGKINMLKTKIARIKSAADSVSDNGAVGTFNMQTSLNKNYRINDSEIAGEFATGPDMKRLKEDQLKTAPPVLLAEDVRRAYKRALKIAWKRFEKNLDTDIHEVKAALHDNLTQYKIKDRIATAMIEAAFEQAGDKFFDMVLKRADEIADMSDEGIADIEKVLEITVTVNPEENTIDDIEAEIEDAEEHMEEEEEAETDDLEEKLVEGSFKMPKVAKRHEGNLLGAAMASYRFQGEK